MALSDDDKVQLQDRSKNRKITTGSNHRWSDNQKIEAIATYLTMGNLALTAKLTGIPEITLRVWKTTEWWKNVVEDLKAQEKIQVSHRMKTIIETAHAVVANRLENGDPVLNQKTGQIIMKPVSMKDAHKVAVDLHNQRDMLERVVAPGRERESSNDDKLKQLAEKFAEFATKKIEQNTKKQITVTDVIFAKEQPSAIHEERETGLQEGECPVQLPSGECEEEGGTEPSPEPIGEGGESSQG